MSSLPLAPSVRAAEPYRSIGRRLVRLALIGLLGVHSALSAAAPPAKDQPRLQQVRDRGSVICGVNAGLPGFATTNSLGEYAGLDIDLCRAVATAVFDDPGKVEYLPLDSDTGFSALAEGRVDLLSRNSPWTLASNTRYGEFAGINYYDGQSFMVSRHSGIRSALQLDNVRVCVVRRTRAEHHAHEFFRVSGLRYQPVYLADEAALSTALQKGQCDVLTADRSRLAAYRSRLAQADGYRILPEMISKEPLGPMVPYGDPAWANVVRWSLNCMINAEELGITHDSVDRPDVSASLAARRLLGLDDRRPGQWLGLQAGWCAGIVRQVGNYAESYARHFGPDTALGLERGVNELWTNGGLLYAPPIR